MIIYDALYSILHTYIFGNMVLNTYQDFVLTQISTIGSVCVCLLPLIAIFCLLKFFLGTVARW